MAKSIEVNQNRRGRPATGRDPVVAVRLPEALLTRLDGVRGPSGAQITRSEAIRLVLERALKSSKAAKPSASRQAKGDDYASAAAIRRVEKAQAHEKPGTGRGKRKQALTEIPAELLGRKEKPKGRS